MRHPRIAAELFVQNRARLRRRLLPNSLALVNANDILPTNADGTLLLHQNSDLFYLTGVRQEETILLLYPDAHEEKFSEILFLRESTPLVETWEGHKLSKDEAREVSGIARVEWTSSFPGIFHTLMSEAERAYLNANEHAELNEHLPAARDLGLAASVVDTVASVLTFIPDFDINLDLNFHFKPEACMRIARALEPYNLHWLEIDNPDPDAIRQIKESTSTQICTGETLIHMKEYLPFFQRHAAGLEQRDV